MVRMSSFNNITSLPVLVLGLFSIYSKPSFSTGSETQVQFIQNISLEESQSKVLIWNALNLKRHSTLVQSLGAQLQPHFRQSCDTYKMKIQHLQPQNLRESSELRKRFRLLVAVRGCPIQFIFIAGRRGTT